MVDVAAVQEKVVSALGAADQERRAVVASPSRPGGPYDPSAPRNIASDKFKTWVDKVDKGPAPVAIYKIANATAY